MTVAAATPDDDERRALAQRLVVALAAARRGKRRHLRRVGRAEARFEIEMQEARGRYDAAVSAALRRFLGALRDA